MAKIHIKEHIWLATILTYLYPVFNKYSQNEQIGTSYLKVINILCQRNPFFEPYYNSVKSEKIDMELLETIVQSGIYLSSMELTKQSKPYEVVYRPLQSVFSNLFGQGNEKKFIYPLKPLNIKNILPTPDDVKENTTSEKLLSSFVNELEKISQREQLLYLLEKYFWAVASREAADISLYDEMKTAAAISTVLYMQYEEGHLNINEWRNLFQNTSRQFLLIHGDVSGIQKFIFSIPSNGAAKSLKGRSVYIATLSDLIVRHLLDELDLDSTNLLYNGGGNFFILAPFCKQEKFVRVRQYILNHLLLGHDGNIYFAIESVHFSTADFQDFAAVWEKSKVATNRNKKRKWNEINLRSQYDKIFGPLDQGVDEGHVCHVCGSFGSKRPIAEVAFEEDKAVKVCTLCHSFITLTNELRNANYLVYRKVNQKKEKYDTYQDIFHHFGYDISFQSNKKSRVLVENEKWYKINDTEFIDEGCSGFRFGAYRLPHEEGQQLTFEALSKLSVIDNRGDMKLAHLKLDVDNLGMLFGIGLGENRSISRVSVLSRMFSLYFGGYINQLIKENHWENQLYVVFSGGDDTYIVGAWRTVLEFVEKFYRHFRTFTCENRFVTFSAGININPYTYPVVRAADLTEQALEAAKKTREEKDEGLPPIKNKVSFLGEVFNWEEFDKIKQIETIVEKMVLRFNRGVLFKIYKSTLGFKHILNDSTKGKFQHVRFWRLAYYLRDIKKEYEKSKKKNQSVFEEDYVEQLIEEYRQIVLHNMFKEDQRDQIRKIMIIPAAVKWAELATRKVEEEE